MKLHNRKPDISNLYKILRREKPDRPTLFELFLNNNLYQLFAGRELPKSGDWELEYLKLLVEAYAAAGYDYVSTNASDFGFNTSRDNHGKSTLSLNEGAVISDEDSFKAFKWPEPDNFSCARLGKIKPFLPDGMKIMVTCPSGVLENTIKLTGYDNLCFMIYDNPDLAAAVFDNVGKRLYRYYQQVLEYDTVGLLMSNDDWGFKTQTFLSPEDMKKYVFPWHKKYVELAHAKGIPAMLHSCGYMGDVMDSVIDELGFDGKHSYEDVIMPVEDAYDKWGGRIAILGGIDLDFILKRSEEEITARSRSMLKRAESRGGYALGTGNSVPEYVPVEKYLAMTRAALEY